ncbi:MAG TPA: UDP-N-acetylmuramate dehydrogenase [Candidatus Andersenbacteria bacterium]|nr:UDP-N-acetylmuramate dehydrogenase [Candidatus Andersenbacteria bacterium]
MSAWQENVALAQYTNIGLGGPARFFVSIHEAKDLTEALVAAQQRNLPVHILGGGSNTVFADQGFDGLVIHIALRGIDWRPQGESMLVTVGAGEDWDALVAETVARNLAGLECLSGIPGVVGATPMQNVGAYGQQVSDVITNVTVLDRTTLTEHNFSNADCQFGHRDSLFKSSAVDRFVITSVTYRLTPSGPPTLKYPQVQAVVGSSPSLSEVREAVLTLRRQKSMVADPQDPHSRSCGSFFVNPVMSDSELQSLIRRYRALGGEDDVPVFIEGDLLKVPAAWLIEHAGFAKGTRRGGVGISPNHALGLVNYDGTTQELLSLASDVQQGVLKKFGLRLVLEPVVVAAAARG